MPRQFMFRVVFAGLTAAVAMSTRRDRHRSAREAAWVRCRAVLEKLRARRAKKTAPFDGHGPPAPPSSAPDAAELDAIEFYLAGSDVAELDAGPVDGHGPPAHPTSETDSAGFGSVGPDAADHDSASSAAEGSFQLIVEPDAAEPEMADDSIADMEATAPTADDVAPFAASISFELISHRDARSAPPSETQDRTLLDPDTSSKYSIVGMQGGSNIGPNAPEAPDAPSETDSEDSDSSDGSEHLAKDFEQLEYETLLSQGPNGRVSIRRAPNTGRLYVVKSVRSEPWQKAREFPHEYKVLYRLPRLHRNIVAVYALLREPKQLDHPWHIIMEYCDGGDLLRFFAFWGDKRAQIPEMMILHFVASMSEALAFLHCGLYYRKETDFLGVAIPETNDSLASSPVIHRDVKLENIFLRWNRRNRYGMPDIVLGDFGFAVEANKSRGVCGTVGYLPPEYFYALEIHEHDPAMFDAMDLEGHWMSPGSDVFAFGVCLFALLTFSGYLHGSCNIAGAFEWTVMSQDKTMLRVLEDCLRTQPENRVKSQHLFYLASVWHCRLARMYEDGERMPANSWPLGPAASRPYGPVAPGPPPAQQGRAPAPSVPRFPPAQQSHSSLLPPLPPSPHANHGAGVHSPSIHPTATLPQVASTHKSEFGNPRRYSEQRPSGSDRVGEDKIPSNPFREYASFEEGA